MLYAPFEYTLVEYCDETESKNYGAATFNLNGLAIKFRVAKITPTKEGFFVTLWKRDEKGITQPHEEKDPFNYYVISVKLNDLFGQFVFPKSLLLKQGILSGHEKEGKLGFRVYPPWCANLNKTATKTQTWQSDFFLEIRSENDLTFERVHALYTNK